jgi:outer membrane lipopolysaccharide assembly protein LptE/RlpB
MRLHIGKLASIFLLLITTILAGCGGKHGTSEAP